MSLNDDIFKSICVQDFKEKGNRLLKKLKIAILPKLEIIMDPNKKLYIDQISQRPNHRWSFRCKSIAIKNQKTLHVEKYKL